MNSEMRTLTIL